MLDNMRNSCLIFRGVRNPIENTLLSSSLEMTHTRAPLFYVAEYIPWIQYPQSFLPLLFHMLTISIYPYFSSFHFYFNGIVLLFPNRYIHLWEWNRNSIFIQRHFSSAPANATAPAKNLLFLPIRECPYLRHYLPDPIQKYRPVHPLSLRFLSLPHPQALL